VNIENLHLFCLVVEKGSISQAARLSNVSQPAATRQVHQLENKYETLFFDRIDGKLKITDAGKALYPFAKEIVKDYNRSKERIQQITGEEESKLSVGATLTIGEYFLPEVLGGFKRENPDTKLMLDIANTPAILDKLSNDVIDIALVEGVVDNDSFHTEKFADDEIILVCSPDHSWAKEKEISIQDLASEHIIWRESTSGTRLILESVLKEYGVLDKLESYMELGSTQAIKSAVEAALGVGFLPRITVAKELKNKELAEVKIKDTAIYRDLWLVKKEQRFPRKNADIFVDYLKNR